MIHIIQHEKKLEPLNVLTETIKSVLKVINILSRTRRTFTRRSDDQTLCLLFALNLLMIIKFSQRSAKTKIFDVTDYNSQRSA